MSNVAVEAEGLSKRYRIGAVVQPGGSLRETLIAAAGAPFRNLRRLRHLTRFDERDSENIVWALRDVSFQVKVGEAVGIVGRNGAGKSTLLKILSQITKPTSGWARVQGNVGSLLEVGTGFHPELTGRENVYLNGSILGMDRRYIDRTFDEIVEFAGIGRYIDTPVKRYSSGMHLRLAFAVAAHLEPEVLIVDEVLAVGDAEFQRKCLGKMEEVAKEGRTVLFVSHNIGAVRALCDRAILLRGGEILLDSDVDEVVSTYLAADAASGSLIEWTPDNAPQNSEIRFIRAYILNEEEEYASSLDSRKPFSIVVEYEILDAVTGLRVGFFMQNSEGIPICGSNDPDAWPKLSRGPGFYTSRCVFPGHMLNSGRYSIHFGADTTHSFRALVITAYCLTIDVEDVQGHGQHRERLPGVLRPKLEWAVEQSTPASV